MRFFRLFFAVFFFAAAFFLRFAICCPPSHDHHGGVASVRVANRSALHFVYYSTTKKAAFHLMKCVCGAPSTYRIASKRIRPRGMRARG